MIKRTVFSVVVIVAAISVLWGYLWENEDALSLYFIISLCVLTVSYVALHLLRCRKYAIIPLVGILDGLTLIFSLYVLEFLPAFIVVIVGFLIYSTFYVYWIVKENGKAILSSLIFFWVASIVFFVVVVNGLILYRMALAEGARHRYYQTISSDSP